MIKSADLPQRQSTRQKKPTIPFDEQIPQSLKPSKPSKPPKPPKALTEPFKSTQNASTSEGETSEDDAIQLLCNKTKVLYIQARQIDKEEDRQGEQDNLESVSDKKAKKKAMAEAVARLRKLPFEDIVEIIPDVSGVIFKPFSPDCLRDPKVNISCNIDATDPLALLDLFIPSKMYNIIAENTNLYAIANNAPIALTSTNTQY